MWREQLDCFWDGRHRLALCALEGGARRGASARPELTISSAQDAGFEPATLVDVVDATRWRAGVVLFDIPARHRYVRLLSADGAELVLRLGDETETPQGGDWRVMTTLLPEAGAAESPTLKLAAAPARGEFERLAREQTVAAGARLVWAIGQRRVAERMDDGAIVARLTPARRVFPAQRSRLVLEAAPLSADAGADDREAPFAIMNHWLREQGAPRVILRLRIPDSLEESAPLLQRAAVVLIMRQRWRLGGWMRAQRDVGEPVIDPLTFDDLRQATGEPAEYPDAVETSEAVVVVNLLRLIADPDDAGIDGVALRRSREKIAPGVGETVEIEFYGAALGDDVGLVCPAATAGDLAIAPADPGGAPYARLFRVDGDALTPRRASDDDGALDEALRRAADVARVPAGAASRAIAERAAGLQGRRDKFVTALNDALTRADYAPRLASAEAWELLEPLALSSFAALVAATPAPERARIRQLGGYNAWRADPALFAALARGGDLAQAAKISAGLPRASLLQRYLAACGADGMAAELAPQSEARALRALSQESGAVALRAAHVAFADDAIVRRAAEAAAATLADEMTVAQAQAHFETQGDADAADALRAYLDARRAGLWTPATLAPALAELVARARLEGEMAPTAPEERTPEELAPPPRPKGFFAGLRGFFR